MADKAKNIGLRRAVLVLVESHKAILKRIIRLEKLYEERNEKHPVGCQLPKDSVPIGQIHNGTGSGLSDSSSEGSDKSGGSGDNSSGESFPSIDSSGPSEGEN